MPSECEQLQSERPCGVLAVGRCRHCGKAFCASHQAQYRAGELDSAGIPVAPVRRISLTDACRTCYEALPALHKAEDDSAARRQIHVEAYREMEAKKKPLDDLAAQNLRAFHPDLRALVSVLLKQLEDAGRPGVTRLGSGLLNRTRGYFLFSRTEDLGMKWAEPYRPTVVRYITTDGRWVTDTPEYEAEYKDYSSRGSDLEHSVRSLYHRALSVTGVAVPLTEAIHSQPGWSSDLSAFGKPFRDEDYMSPF